MPICGEQIGMDANDFFDPMDMAIGAFDNYFTGNLTDTHRRHDRRAAGRALLRRLRR